MTSFSALCGRPAIWQKVVAPHIRNPAAAALLPAEKMPDLDSAQEDDWPPILWGGREIAAIKAPRAKLPSVTQTLFALAHSRREENDFDESGSKGLNFKVSTRRSSRLNKVWPPKRKELPEASSISPVKLYVPGLISSLQTLDEEVEEIASGNDESDGAEQFSIEEAEFSLEQGVVVESVGEGISVLKHSGKGMASSGIHFSQGGSGKASAQMASSQAQPLSSEQQQASMNGGFVLQSKPKAAEVAAETMVESGGGSSGYAQSSPPEMTSPGMRSLSGTVSADLQMLSGTQSASHGGLEFSNGGSIEGLSGIAVSGGVWAPPAPATKEEEELRKRAAEMLKSAEKDAPTPPKSDEQQSSRRVQMLKAKQSTNSLEQYAVGSFEYEQLQKMHAASSSSSLEYLELYGGVMGGSLAAETGKVVSPPKPDALDSVAMMQKKLNDIRFRTSLMVQESAERLTALRMQVEQKRLDVEERKLSLQQRKLAQQNFLEARHRLVASERRKEMLRLEKKLTHSYQLQEDMTARIGSSKTSIEVALAIQRRLPHICPALSEYLPNIDQPLTEQKRKKILQEIHLLQKLQYFAGDDLASLDDAALKEQLSGIWKLHLGRMRTQMRSALGDARALLFELNMTSSSHPQTVRRKLTQVLRTLARARQEQAVTVEVMGQLLQNFEAAFRSKSQRLITDDQRRDWELSVEECEEQLQHMLMMIKARVFNCWEACSVPVSERINFLWDCEFGCVPLREGGISPEGVERAPGAPIGKRGIAILREAVEVAKFKKAHRAELKKRNDLVALLKAYRPVLENYERGVNVDPQVLKALVASAAPLSVDESFAFPQGFAVCTIDDSVHTLSRQLRARYDSTLHELREFDRSARPMYDAFKKRFGMNLAREHFE